MGVYRKYTITRRVPMPVVFKCQICQKINVVLNPFALEATYNDKGTFSQKVVKGREERAKEYLDGQQLGLYGQVFDATQHRRFKNAGYVCKCTQCNNTPAWSNYPIKLVDSISAIAIFVSIVMALIWLISLVEEPLPVSDLLPALKVLIIGNLPAIIAYTIKGIRVRSMAKEYMPMVFQSTEQLQQAIAKNEIRL